MIHRARLQIEQLQVGALQTNCYLVIADTGQLLIVDPGDDADYIMRRIADIKGEPTAIVATHGHFDHLMAAYELQVNYGIHFLIHKKDEFLVRAMRESARHFLKVDAGPVPNIDNHLQDGDNITLGKTEMKVIETPGHTPGSVALWSKEASMAFVGDLLFAQGAVGRTDFSYSSPKKLERSLQEILKLPPETALFTGHGLATTVSTERKHHKV